MGRVHVLGNPATSGGRARIAEVATALAGRGVEPIVLDGATAADSLAAAKVAVGDGAERVLAVGGDGVANIAVNAVARTGVVLGLVPDGTGNDFARALGLLDGHLDDHLDRALAEPVAIDAIESDHGWVATVATLGFSGDVTARANALRRPRGQQRYTVATVLELPRLCARDVSVEVDGDVLVQSTTLLAVGTTAYFGGGMRICPGAEPDDGLLHVVSIADVPRLRFLRVFPTVFSGRHVDRPEVVTASGTVVEVAGDRVDLWADGELLGPLPVTLRLAAGALRVAGAVTPDRR